MSDWKEKSEYKSDVTIDVGFMVQDSFYYGPDNGFTQEQYKELRVPLVVPDLKISGNFVLTADLVDKEHLLLEHYKSVIAMHKKHNKDASRSPHFWNRPTIFKSNDFCIGFPWHDRFREGRNVLTSLTSVTDGEVYWDRDQGWELEIYGEANSLFAREWDPDNEEIYCQVKFDWDRTREKANTLITRTTEIIGYLTREVGHDYWT